MKTKREDWIRCRANAHVLVLSALMCFASGSAGYCQSTAGPAGTELQKIVQMVHAEVSDENIINYIKTSGATFALSADDVLKLSDQGISHPVLVAMLQTKPAGPATGGVVATSSSAPSLAGGDGLPADPNAAPGSATGITTAPPSEAVNFAYFKDQLDPYGQWQDIATNGTCWVPNELQTNPNWRPYVDRGSWAYTDDGWFWKSEYPWGEVVFHYGRWFNEMTVRWAWAPGYDWGPAWVAWRGSQPAQGTDPAAVGWAPLPPAAQFEPGVGVEYNGAVVAEDTDFGLPPSAYVYVDAGHFWDQNVVAGVIYDPLRLQYLYQQSVPDNVFVVQQDGGFVMNGLGLQKMGVMTQRTIRPEQVVIRNRTIDGSRATQKVSFASLNTRFRSTGEQIGPGAIRADRHDWHAHADRHDWHAPADRHDWHAHADRHGWHAHADRHDWHAHADRHDWHAPADRHDWHAPADRHDWHAHADRHDWHAHADRHDWHAHADRHDWHAHADRHDWHAHVPEWSKLRDAEWLALDLSERSTPGVAQWLALDLPERPKHRIAEWFALDLPERPKHRVAEWLALDPPERSNPGVAQWLALDLPERPKHAEWFAIELAVSAFVPDTNTPETTASKLKQQKQLKLGALFFLVPQGVGR